MTSRGFLLLLGAPALLACGSTVTVLPGGEGGAGTTSTTTGTTGTTATTTGSTGSTGSTTGSTGTTTGSTGTTGTTSTGTGGGPPLRDAVLEVVDYGPGSQLVYVAFRDTPAPWCKPLGSDAGCEVYQCPQGEPPNVSAGPIYAAWPNGKIELSPNPGGDYDPADVKGIKFGSPVQFFVSGSAQVPPFDVTVVLSAPPMVYAPTQETKFVAGQPLTVAWDGGQGRLFFGIYSNSDVGLLCEWDVGVGKIQVPGPLMGMLPKGQATFYTYAGDKKELVIADWQVTAYAVTADPMAYGDVTIQ